MDDLLHRLGLSNPAAEDGLRGWPAVDQERLLTWRPDAVFLGGGQGDDERAEVSFRRRFEQLFLDPQRAPSVIVVGSSLLGTVSQRIGDLALELAGSLVADRDRENQE